MKYTLLFIAALFAAQVAKSQEVNGIDPKVIPAEKPFTYVQQMPKPGFDLGKYLSENLRYPDAARQNNIQGRVIVRFVVNVDGSISDTKVLRGIGGGCDEEAKRVIMSMPNWKPGMQEGVAVKVYFTQPISFNLTDPEPAKTNPTK